MEKKKYILHRRTMYKLKPKKIGSKLKLFIILMIWYLHMQQVNINVYNISISEKAVFFLNSVKSDFFSNRSWTTIVTEF